PLKDSSAPPSCDPDELYRPFASDLEWRIAHWAVTEGVAQNAINRLLNIPEVMDRLGISFKNYHALNEKLAEIPERAGKWFTRALSLRDQPDEVYILRARDPVEAIRSLWGDPTLAEHLVFRPKKIFADATQRVHRALRWPRVDRRYRRRLLSSLRALLIVAIYAIPLYVNNALLAMSLKRKRSILDDEEKLQEELDALVLPIPGLSAPTASYARSANKLSQPDLSKLCNSLGEPYTGNKTKLKERLLKVSREQEKWNILKPGVSKNLKAPQGKTTSSTKLWATCRKKLFITNGEGDLPSTTGDGYVVQEKEYLRKWYRMVNEECPYIPREERRQVAAAQAAHTSSIRLPDVLCDALRQQLVQELREMIASAAPLGASNNVAATSPIPATSNNTPGLAGTERPTTPPPPSNRSTMDPPSGNSSSTAVSSVPPHMQMSPPPPTPASPSRMRRIILPAPTGPVELTIHESELPPLPAGVGSDIARIASTWAYDEHWRGESALQLHGHPVPMQYWPSIFKYWRRGNRDTIKSDFVKWRDVALAWRKHGSAEAFCEQYTTTDKRGKEKHMPYTKIVKSLREERSSKAAELEGAARARFGADFDRLFGYRKGDKYHAYSDPIYIARRYIGLLREQGEDVRTLEEIYFGAEDDAAL
ncbi:hypothetical protein FB107DRAFT_279580, partial [Schizophyllum commune]